jgi:ABC-type transport system involved in multi-copper enzyme maturation permease subunit
MEESNMANSILAEITLLRKRVATWVLLAIWLALSMLFSYGFPYLTYRSGSDFDPRAKADILASIIPSGILTTLTSGFPFYGGVIALMLGVLALGSEFGWGTIKTMYTVGPSRLTLFTAKMVAVAVALIVFVLTEFALGAIASTAIATAESAAIHWPSPADFARSFATGWFLMLVWATFGVLLAVITRGTALAIGIGIIYALIIENLVGAFASSLSWLQPIVEQFLRASGYSLVQALGLSLGGDANNGPGGYSGPYVSGTHAFAVLIVYLVVFAAVSAFLLRQRDVA